MPENDTVVERELSLDSPCALGAGVLSADVVAGNCSNLWFVGKLVRDDRAHGLVPGLYDDFGREVLPPL